MKFFCVWNGFVPSRIVYKEQDTCMSKVQMTNATHQPMSGVVDTSLREWSVSVRASTNPETFSMYFLLFHMQNENSNVASNSRSTTPSTHIGKKPHTMPADSGDSLKMIETLCLATQMAQDASRKSTKTKSLVTSEDHEEMNVAEISGEKAAFGRLYVLP